MIVANNPKVTEPKPYFSKILVCGERAYLFLRQWIRVSTFFLFFFSQEQKAISQLPMTEAEFVARVLAFHPTAVRADLRIDLANAQLLTAKGGFDPVLGLQFDQKQYADKNYYSRLDGQVKVPTPIGLDLKAGYEANTGQFLNPENNVPIGGLLYAGVSFPILQGLWFDERRARLRVAKLGIDQSQAVRRYMRNELAFEATSLYWSWYEAYEKRRILIEAFENANIRYDAVVQNVLSGDRPGIDSIEARVQLQNLSLAVQQADIDLLTAVQFLRNALWTADGPYAGPINETPILDQVNDNFSNINDLTASLFDFGVENHPYIQSLQLKLAQLEVEQRLARENLKPVLTLDYAPLSQVQGGNVLENIGFENYKWGVGFKFPLFLRKERGKLNEIKVKMLDTKAEVDQLQELLKAQYTRYVNTWFNLNDQIRVYEDNIVLLRNLLDAEIRLFDIGESSIFLVNAREFSWIQAAQKLVEFRSKNRFAYAASLYYAGILYAD